MRSATRASRALFASLLVASSLLAGGAAVSLAQAEAGVGVEVPYVDNDGIARGTVELRQLDDPFVDFDASAPPEAGNRYVGTVVAFTAADDQQMDAYPYSVQLIDTTGRIWAPSYVPRPADALVPDAENQTMAPGNRVSGFIGYSLPGDAVIDRVIYTPDYDRVLLLADVVPGAGPTPGDKVRHTSTDGAQGDVSATVIDPFPDFDPGYPAPEGMRYVMLDAAFDGAGDRGYVANPYYLILHLADGHLVFPTQIPRPYDAARPILESQTLSPGDHISGFVPFVIPADAEVIAVEYQPESSQRLVVADLVGGGPAAPSASPAPGPSEAPAVTTAPAASPAPSEPVASAGTAQ